MNVHRAQCRICRNTAGNTEFTAREMMFGMPGEFTYAECGACGCLQIVKVPANLPDYYPEGYYSLDPHGLSLEGELRRFLKKARARSYLGRGGGILGKLMLKKFGPGFLEKIRPAGVTFDSAILDVGSGLGDKLVQLANDGFIALTGIDPHILEDVQYDGRVRVYRRSVAEMNGEFDLVMLNHSFEHMDEPRAVLGHLDRLLKPGGTALIRIPVADSWSRREYGPHWVNLDAPRHLYLHTRKSMEILAGKAGFTIAETLHDSDECQFWASEQYSRGIPLMDERSYFRDPDNGMFSKARIAEFKAKAAELNRARDGDKACFYLRRA